MARKAVHYEEVDGKYRVYKNKKYYMEFSKEDLTDKNYIHLGEPDDYLDLTDDVGNLWDRITFAREKILTRYNTARMKNRMKMEKSGIDKETIEGILSGEIFSRGAEEGEKQFKDSSINTKELSNLKVGSEDIEAMLSKAKEFANKNKMENLSKQIQRTEELLAEYMLKGANGQAILQKYVDATLSEYFYESKKTGGKVGRKTKKSTSIAQQIIQDRINKIKDNSTIKPNIDENVGSRLNTTLQKLLQTIYALSDDSVVKKNPTEKNFEKAICDAMRGWNSIIAGENGEGCRLVAALEATNEFFKETQKEMYSFKTSKKTVGGELVDVEINCIPEKDFANMMKEMPKIIEKLKNKLVNKTDSVVTFWNGDTLITEFHFTIKNYKSVEVISEAKNKSVILNTTDGKSISTVSSTPLRNVLEHDLYFDKEKYFYSLIQLGAVDRNSENAEWDRIMRDAKKIFMLSSLVGRENTSNYVNTFIKINGVVIPIEVLWDYIKNNIDNDKLVIVSPSYFIDKKRLRSYNMKITSKNGDEDNIFLGRLRSAAVKKKAYDLIHYQKVSGRLAFNNFKINF